MNIGIDPAKQREECTKFNNRRQSAEIAWVIRLVTGVCGN